MFKRIKRSQIQKRTLCMIPLREIQRQAKKLTYGARTEEAFVRNDQNRE